MTPHHLEKNHILSVKLNFPQDLLARGSYDRQVTGFQKAGPLSELCLIRGDHPL